jgi:hypothetical protein
VDGSLQRVKLSGFEVVITELEVELDYLRRATACLEEWSFPKHPPIAKAGPARLFLGIGSDLSWVGESEPSLLPVYPAATSTFVEVNDTGCRLLCIGTTPGPRGVAAAA